MKRFLLIMLFLLFASPSWGWMNLITSGGGVPVAASSDYAVECDDSDSYGTVTDGGTSDYDLTNNFTVECWIYFDETGPSANKYLIRKEDAFHIQCTSANTLRFTVYYNSGSIRDCSSTTDVSTLSGWKHIAAVKDSSGHRIYIDGSLDNDDSKVTGNIDTNDNAVRVGHYSTSGAYNWPWVFDEIRVSNSARYTGESYSVPTGEFTSDGNTVALYHLDEGSGSTADDATGDSNNDISWSGTPVLNNSGKW